jgi:ribulose-phosphate 3-epimerase
MEVHLMVENPLAYLKEYADAGFKKFLGHVEKMENLEEFIALGQIFGEVGIALDCDSSVESLNIPFDDIDTILLMSVKAGKSGQEFMPEVLEKIKNIKLKTQIPIEIDGGINDKTIIEAKNSGAQRFVATSFIFSSSDPMQSFEKLTSLT